MFLPIEITLAHGDVAKPPFVSKSSDFVGWRLAALLKNMVIKVPNIFVHEKPPPPLSWIWFVWMSSSISSNATFFNAFGFSANLRSPSSYRSDGTNSLGPLSGCCLGNCGGRYWAAMLLVAFVKEINSIQFVSLTIVSGMEYLLVDKQSH